MNPEERELLNRAIKLSEENNKMLRSMRRSARFSSFIRLIYWIIIVVAAFSAYFFVKPYLDAAIKGYVEMQKGIQTVSNVTNKLPEFPSLPSWLGGENK